MGGSVQIGDATVESVGDRVLVTLARMPERTAFLRAASVLGATWIGRRGTFPIAARDRVLALCRTHFGLADGQTTELAPILIDPTGATIVPAGPARSELEHLQAQLPALEHRARQLSERAAAAARVRDQVRDRIADLAGRS